MRITLPLVDFREDRAWVEVGHYYTPIHTSCFWFPFYRILELKGLSENWGEL